MKTNLLLVLFFLIGILSLTAQDNCSKFYPMTEGVTIEYTNYNKKGKVEGVSSYIVTNSDTDGNTTNATMAINLKDEKGKEIYSTDYKLSCTGNMVTLDYESLLPSDMMNQYGDMDIEVSGNDIEIPNDLSVGQNLADANVTMNISMSGINMKIAVDMLKRKVEKKENVTTPAGTYDCYVLYSENQSKVMMANQVYPSRVWLAEGVGMVKQETYKKNGDLMSSTMLTAYSK
jgi:predicted RND superfamily exporter protein